MEEHEIRIVLVLLEREGMITLDSDVESCVMTILEKYSSRKELSSNETLSVQMLRDMKPGMIFKTGTLLDERICNVKIRWIAKRGDGYHDWAIYYYLADKSIEFIKTQGNKMFNEDVIKQLVPCDDGAFSIYRG